MVARLRVDDMKGLLPIAATLVPISAWAADTVPEPYTWGPHMMWGGAWYGMMLGPIFMILVLAVVIAVAVLIVRGLSGPWHGTLPPHYTAQGRSPLDILKERFARGEIDKEEFEDRRRVLGE